MYASQFDMCDENLCQFPYKAGEINLTFFWIVQQISSLIIILFEIEQVAFESQMASKTRCKQN